MPDNEHTGDFINQSIILAFGWLVIYWCHEYIVPYAKIPILIALTDPMVHFTIAALLVLPFFIYKLIDWKIFAAAMFLAIFIDLDHALAARSFDLKKMLTLPTRPIGHSFLFVFITSIVVTLILKGFKLIKQYPWLVAYILFIALFSHIMRDAINTDNTPWRWPFESKPIRKSVYFIGFMSLNLVHLVGCYQWSKRQSKINSQP